MATPWYEGERVDFQSASSSPVGMVARQFLRTFMAASATAVGVRASSHAVGKNNNKIIKDQKKTKKKLFHEVKRNSRSLLLAMVPLKEREMDFLDSSSAGVCSRGTVLTS